MKIAIVTDSTAVVADKYKQKENLAFLKIPVIIDGKAQFDLDSDTFYQHIAEAKEFPTTSQPSIGETLETYEYLIQKGYTHIISIHLSGGISGFYQNLVGITSSIEDATIIPFDSHIASLPLGIMVETALDLIDEGKDVGAILEALERMRDAQQIYLVVDDLHHLVRSGRLSNGAAIIGSLLKIKPILEFDKKGNIVVFEKVRTAKRAYRRVEELLLEKIETYKANDQAFYLGIAHAGYKEKAMELAEELSSRAHVPVRVADLGSAIGVHTGARTIGMGIMLDVKSSNQ